MKKFIFQIIKERNVDQLIKLVGIKLLRRFDLLSLVTAGDSLRAQTPFERPELGVLGVARTLSRSLYPARRETRSLSPTKGTASPRPEPPAPRRPPPAQLHVNGDLNDYGFTLDALMLLKRSDGSASRLQ